VRVSVLSGLAMERVRLSDSSRLPLIRRSLSEMHLDEIPDRSGQGGDGFAGGWVNGLANARLFLRSPKDGKVIVDHLSVFPSIQRVIVQLMADRGYTVLKQVMVNRLASGGRLERHRDGLPDDARWHLPLITNPSAKWWDEYNGDVHMDVGYWYGPVPYCGVLHSAVNDGQSERVHIVADFARTDV
jgi:hypothetical protein